jgi:hypothetical protein
MTELQPTPNGRRRRFQIRRRRTETPFQIILSGHQSFKTLRRTTKTRSQIYYSHLRTTQTQSQTKYSRLQRIQTRQQSVQTHLQSIKTRFRRGSTHRQSLPTRLRSISTHVRRPSSHRQIIFPVIEGLKPGYKLFFPAKCYFPP